MRLYEVLKEGYKEAQSEFSTVSGPDTARQVIDSYKQLVTKNQVQGNERNIDWWRKQGWDAFNKFPKAFKFIKNPYPSAKELYQELENNATIPPK